MTRICLAVLILVLSACASQERRESKLESYIGADVQSAVNDLGKPSAVYDMQDGTWEYFWKKNQKGSTKATTSVFGVPLSKSIGSACSKIPVTDKNKRVISYRTSGSR